MRSLSLALALCILQASAFVLQPSVRSLQSSALTGRSPAVVAKAGKKAAEEAADVEAAAIADQEKLLAEILSATKGNAAPTVRAATAIAKPPPPPKPAPLLPPPAKVCTACRP